MPVRPRPWAPIEWLKTVGFRSFYFFALKKTCCNFMFFPKIFPKKYKVSARIYKLIALDNVPNDAIFELASR